MQLAMSRAERPGIAGILVAVMLFAMIFTAGMGYLLYSTQTNLSSYKAQAQAVAAREGALEEQLSFFARCSSNILTLYVDNTGGIPLSVISVYVKSSGQMVSPPGIVALGSPGTNATGPLNLAPGETQHFSLTGYSYSCAAQPIVDIYLSTSRGNTFSNQFPVSAIIATTTVVSSIKTTVSAPGGGGGNSLVVVMVATPVQVFSGNIVTDNVTIFNYASTAMTGAVPSPSSPTFSTTGTATLTFQACSVPYTPPGQQSGPGSTIPGYSGSGVAPHIYYLCTYKASSGSVGGLASFSGAAYAYQGATQVQAATVTSNLVQIGGLTNVLNQGVFSSNFFFFKYTSCTNQPSSSGFGFGNTYTYPSGCTKNTTIPPASPYSLPEADPVSVGSDYYVAFYVQITNNFNTTLPLLQYTYEQFEPSAGSESNWFIVGTTATESNGAYYPNYSPGGTSVPTLTAYPTDCATVNAQNVPTDANCIYVNPGQTVTVTLAACGPGLSTWDWGGTKYGDQFDGGGSGCTSSTPDWGSGGSAAAGVTVISFEYKGQLLTEDLAFQGVAFTS